MLGPWKWIDVWFLVPRKGTTSYQQEHPFAPCWVMIVNRCLVFGFGLNIYTPSPKTKHYILWAIWQSESDCQILTQNFYSWPSGPLCASLPQKKRKTKYVVCPFSTKHFSPRVFYGNRKLKSLRTYRDFSVKDNVRRKRWGNDDGWG